MKYIIIPILRFLKLVFFLFICYPIMFVFSLFMALWHFDSKYILNSNNTIWEEDWNGQFYYKTPLDWYFRRKTKKHID